MTADTAYLTGHGRLAWERALALLDGCACTWSDLDGVRLVDAPPDTFPVGATHLWGWGEEGRRCVRLRFDHEAVYAAVLRVCPSPGERGTGELVIPQVRRATLWGPKDRQAGPLPAEVLARKWELLDISGAAPVTFVRAWETKRP